MWNLFPLFIAFSGSSLPYMFMFYARWIGKNKRKRRKELVIIDLCFSKRLEMEENKEKKEKNHIFHGLEIYSRLR